MSSNESQLKASIVDLSNPHFLRVAKDHIIRLLEYAQRGPSIGPDTFKNDQEYKDFALSKFFVDKVISSLKRVSNPEAEEGEIGSDDEDNRESTPLVLFPLTKLEQTKQIFAFWDGASVGDVYIAKVVAVGEQTYDLTLLNKSEELGTIYVYSISAFMYKNSLKESLKINDLVRVAILGHIKREDSIKMKVTADPSEAEGLKNKKLGKISVSEFVRPFSESSNQIRWSQIHRHEMMDKNHQNTFDVMSQLGLDPHRPYTFLPDIKRNKTHRHVNKKEVSAEQENSTKELKTALQIKEMGDLKLAKNKASEAIRIYPENDLAYAVRGSLTIKTADQDADTIIEGVADCIKSLNLNRSNLIARKEISGVLVECAVILSKNEASFSYAKEYVEKALEIYETEEARALHHTLQSLMDVGDITVE